MGCDILFPFMEGSFFFFRKKLLDFSSLFVSDILG